MEVLLGLFALGIFLAPLILSLVNSGKVNALTRRLQQLEFSLLQMRNEFESLRKGTPQQKPAPEVAPESKGR